MGVFWVFGVFWVRLGRFVEVFLRFASLPYEECRVEVAWWDFGLCGPMLGVV